MSCNCDNFDILYNFISPVTGRVLADPNYVLVGNRQGIATPSPILIDIRLDLIALRKRYNTLVTGDIIIGHPNDELPNAQVLFNLENGYLYNTEGVVSINTIIPIGDLPDILYQNIWIGDLTNRPVARQRVGLENLPSFLSLTPTPDNLRKNLGMLNLYTGKSVVSTTPLDAGLPGTTMRIDKANMPNLTVGRMLIGVKNITPPLYVDPFTPPYIFVTGDLNWDPFAIGSDSYGVPNEIGLDPGDMFIGDMTPGNEGQITTTNAFKPLLSLTYKAIWRGDATNRPVEVFDLSVLEGKVSSIETTIINIQFQIGQLEVQLGALQLQVGALDTALGLLTLEVQAIASTVAGLVISVGIIGSTVAALGLAVTTLQAQVTQLFNRTLDQIPLATADVNLNGHKIINLANPINPLDAVNLQSMTAAIAAGSINSVVGTANQITAVTVTGAVTLSLPSAVIITTSLAAGNLELIGNTLQSNNTNGNILLNPNGTGNIDVNNHRIINLSNPINPLDAVNLQSMTAAITAGSISSVLGTANQITASTVSGVVTLSLPTAVIITTSLTAGNLELVGNILQSNNTNGNITLTPNGTGNVDISNHRLLNVSNPIGVLDAVNLQTLTSTIASSSISSVLGTTNQITAGTVSGVVTLSLPSAVIITTSLTAGNLELVGNTLQSNNTNGNILLNPNGTGNVDVNNHRILNVSNPVGVLDAVNLQTLTAAVGAGVITSVTGTANQITATTVLGAVTLSLPSSVIITTDVSAGNMKLAGNTLSSTNTNGDINVTPNGVGAILLTTTNGVGINGTPSFPLDVTGTIKGNRYLGRGGMTLNGGLNAVTGTGHTQSVTGSESAGIFTLNTGTGISAAGILATLIFSTNMPSTNYSVVLTAANQNAAGVAGMFIIVNNTANFGVRSTTILTASTTYIWNFLIIGN